MTTDTQVDRTFRTLPDIMLIIGKLSTCNSLRSTRSSLLPNNFPRRSRFGRSTSLSEVCVDATRPGGIEMPAGDVTGFRSTAIAAGPLTARCHEIGALRTGRHPLPLCSFLTVVSSQ